MRILCVDDDEDIRSLLESLLGFSDLEAVAVRDTDSALSLIEKERFSLYIVKPDAREVVPAVKRLLEQARAANP